MMTEEQNEELPTTRALLQLAVERITHFCDAVAPATNLTQALRNAGLGTVWDGLMDAVRRLPPRSGCMIWEVENQKEGCAACPAGRDYALCLVSLDDIKASTCPGVPAPDDCPLRDGGTVLLVGEPGA